MGLLLVLALPAWPREIPFQSLPGGTRMIGDVEYVALTQLVTALGGEVWEVGNKVIAILPPEDDSGIEVVLTRDRARALVNKGAIDLPVPPRFIEGECYVPVALLGELFPSIPRRMPKVLSFALSHLRDTALLRVELDTVTHFSSIAMTSTRFRVFIQAECRLRRLEPSGLVKALEINQRTGTELLITTTEPCYCRAVQDGRSILVRLVPRAPRRVRLIVLDPGHGGQDPGAV
ncbi:MAG: stalk domain-containing protein, partial [candidate division WOR-3 bacterium]